MTSSRRILAIHAHPDDIEFQCAGTLALLAAAGHSIAMATMTPGDCGSRELGPEEIAAVVHFFKTPTLLVGSALLWSFLILLMAFLMISTVRYASFKEFDVKKARPSLALFVTAMLISLIYLYSEVMLLSMATIYVGSGLVGNLVQTVRRFLPSSVTRSEPAHGNIES